MSTGSTETTNEQSGAGMGTTPDERRGSDDITQPTLNAAGWLRWLWRQLTSMRVALILLFMLSVAAIPGSLIPQREISPIKVQQFYRDHVTLAKVYEKFQLFEVFSSWWFAAIYILLFVSLAGCIIPRCWHHAKALRSIPPTAPRNLKRMPAYATWTTEVSSEEALKAARAELKKRRFRTNDGTDSTGAEKGYMRETGNLIFHVALFGVLVAVALGSLYKGSGGKIVIEGSPQGFANTLTQYDDFQPGSLFDTKDMEPFGFTLDKIDQRFQRTGEQTGAPRDFTANVKYWEGADGKSKQGTIKVNHPLQIGDTKVFLIATGYAPDVTVKDAQGNVAYSGPTPFLPQDGNRTSTGVIKVPDVGKGLEQLGFEGIFAPTGVPKEQFGNRGPHSVFPALDNPMLYLTGYHGDLGVDAGIPQSVFRLDPKKMTQFREGGEPVRYNLKPGDTLNLPNGQGSITFNGVKTWGNFQIAQEPGKGLALVSVIAAILGLILSLFIRRRRMWVRATTGEDGRTVVEVAGLARTEGGGLAEEVQAYVDDLQKQVPAAATPAAEKE